MFHEFLTFAEKDEAHGIFAFLCLLTVCFTLIAISAHLSRLALRRGP